MDQVRPVCPFGMRIGTFLEVRSGNDFERSGFGDSILGAFITARSDNLHLHQGAKAMSLHRLSSLLSASDQFCDVELKELRGVQAEDFRALPITEVLHLPLDRLRRMRPRTLCMWIVIGPQKVINELGWCGKAQAIYILLEGDGAVLAEVIAR